MGEVINERGAVYLCYALLLAISGLILFRFLYPPLQDFPEWIYQAQIFNELIRAGPTEGFFVKTYPVPYALSQIVMSGLLTVFSPVATSKLVVGVYVICALLLVRLFISKWDLDRSASSFFLMSVFILNSCFWAGYIGYQIGLVIFVLYLCLSSECKTAPGVICVFGMASFFSHGLIYVPFCVTAGVYCLIRRRVGSLLVGLLPSVSLLVWYLSANPPSTLSYPIALHGLEEQIVYKIYTILKAGPYHDFIIDDGDAKRFVAIYWSGIATNVLFLLIGISYCVSAIGRRGVRSAVGCGEIIAGGILLIVMLALPPTAFGIANPGERLLYPALILGSAFIFKRGMASRNLQYSVAGTVVVGLTLSALSIGAADMKRSPGSRPATNGEGLLTKDPAQRELFAHRLEFEEKMRAAQLSWTTGEMPTLPLAFDTALVGSRKPDR